MGAIDSYLPLLSETNRRWVRFGAIVAGVIGLMWLAGRLSDILTPIALAFVIAYILNPLVTMLEKRGVARMQSTVWIFTLGSLVLAGVLTLILTVGISQTASLISNIDVYRETLERWIGQYFPNWMATAKTATQSAEMKQQLVRIGQTAAAGFATHIGGVLDNVLRWLTALVLIPLYSFFFLLHFNDIVAVIRAHLPALYRERIVKVVSVTDSAVADFFRGRMLVSLGVGVLTALGWMLVGVPYSVPLGLLVGVLNLVPVMSIVVLPAALFFTYLDAAHGGGSWIWPVVLALLVFFLVQAMDNFVLSPYITGQTSGLHPIVTVIALLIGAELGGVLGMLLSIPLTSTLRYLAQEYWLPEIRKIAGYAPAAVAAGGSAAGAVPATPAANAQSLPVAPPSTVNPTKPPENPGS